MRPEAENTALKSRVAELVDALNASDGVQVNALLVSLWDQYFSNGRVYPQDMTKLDIIASYATRYCSDELGFRYQAEYARIKGEPIVFKIHKNRLNEESRYLLRHRKSITSQDGEDGIISKIFETIGAKNKWCVEFGAYDGVVNCNTHTLVVDEGWNGVFIEGSGEQFNKLEKTFENCANAHLFQTIVGYGDDMTPLEDILSSLDAPTDIDLASIDIDGTDWHVWSKLTAYRPRVVIVEFNPSIANDIVFVQQEIQGTFHGNSLLSFVLLGKKKGYELVCVTTYNAIFVVDEEYEKFAIADNSIDAMYEPFSDGRIFHGYDGSIFNVGMPKLLWSREGHDSDNEFIGIHDVKLVRTTQ